MVKTGLMPVEFGRAFNRAHDIRQVADYTGDLIESGDVERLIQQATDFVALIKADYLH